MKPKIAELEKQIAELKAGWQRTQADFDNFRKKNEEDRFNFLNLAKADFMLKITPVLDNFRRAFEHKNDPNWAEGVQHIEKQLEDILGDEGLKKIAAGQDVKFDPNFHEAISCEKNEKIAADHIIAEVESGWMFDSKVLKPAKVRVSQGK